MFFEMRFDLHTMDSGERSLPFGILVVLTLLLSVLFSIVATSLGEKRRAGIYASRAFVCLSCMRYVLSLCQVLDAACDSCTPWTFHLTSCWLHRFTQDRTKHTLSQTFLHARLIIAINNRMNTYYETVYERNGITVWTIQNSKEVLKNK